MTTLTQLRAKHFDDDDQYPTYKKWDWAVRKEPDGYSLLSATVDTDTEGGDAHLFVNLNGLRISTSSLGEMKQEIKQVYEDYFDGFTGSKAKKLVKPNEFADFKKLMKWDF